MLANLRRDEEERQDENAPLSFDRVFEIFSKRS